jgi:hypothetical protein
VDWRAVEADPRLPVGGGRTDVAKRDAVNREFESLDRLLLPGEELPRSTPTFRPNTRGAVSGDAEAYEAGVADDVPRLLFAAYWMRGADIGSPERRCAGCSPAPFCVGKLDVGAGERVRLCDELEPGPDHYGRLSVDPGLVHAVGDAAGPDTAASVVEDRLAVSGETALRRLEKELQRVGARIDPGLPDPGRYPAVSDRPASSWVSQNGGRWRHSWRASA